MHGRLECGRAAKKWAMNSAWSSSGLLLNRAKCPRRGAPPGLWNSSSILTKNAIVWILVIHYNGFNSDSHSALAKMPHWRWCLFLVDDASLAMGPSWWWCLFGDDALHYRKWFTKLFEHHITLYLLTNVCIAELIQSKRKWLWYCFTIFVSIFDTEFVFEITFVSG